MALAVSDVPTYRSVARHRQNCLQVENTTDAWITAVKELIEDVDLRRKLANEARDEIKRYYTTQANSQIYSEVLRRAQGD